MERLGRKERRELRERGRESWEEVEEWKKKAEKMGYRGRIVLSTDESNTHPVQFAQEHVNRKKIC